MFLGQDAFDGFLNERSVCIVDRNNNGNSERSVGHVAGGTGKEPLRRSSTQSSLPCIIDLDSSLQFA